LTLELTWVAWLVRRFIIIAN